MDCKVREVRDICLRDAVGGHVLASYRFHELELEGRASLHFLVLSSGGDFELRAYYAPADWIRGSRDQLIDAGQTWLFLPPPDPEDFISSDLELAPFPDLPPLPDGAGPRKMVFAISGFGRTVFGSYEREGRQVPVMLTEYAAEEADAMNPHLLVLEEAWMDKEGKAAPEGGLVTAMLGCALDPSSVEIYPG